MAGEISATFKLACTVYIIISPSRLVFMIEATKGCQYSNKGGRLVRPELVLRLQ